MAIRITDKYDNINQIGEGNFSSVFKGINKITGQPVVLKQLDPYKFLDYSKGKPAGIEREIDLLGEVGESNQIVTLLESEKLLAYDNKEYYYLVFELLPTDLQKLIKKEKGLNLDTIKTLFYQLCKGLAHCHASSVLHRDIKPENLLVDEINEILKIADLGLGRTFGFPLTQYSPNVGTVMYMAPEILLRSQFYGSPVDIWSAGCVLSEMATGGPLFNRNNSGDEQIEQMREIVRKLGSPTEESWPEASSMLNWKTEFGEIPPQDLNEQFYGLLGSDGVDLLSKMLTYNPNGRISAKDAMDHSFFESLDKSIYE